MQLPSIAKNVMINDLMPNVDKLLKMLSFNPISIPKIPSSIHTTGLINLEVKFSGNLRVITPAITPINIIMTTLNILKLFVFLGLQR